MKRKKVCSTTLLSANNVAERNNTLSSNIYEQRSKFHCHSVALDESTDKTDNAQQFSSEVLIISLRWQKKCWVCVPCMAQPTLEIYVSSCAVRLSGLVWHETDRALSSCLQTPSQLMWSMSPACCKMNLLTCGSTVNWKLSSERYREKQTRLQSFWELPSSLQELSRVFSRVMTLFGTVWETGLDSEL